MFFYTTFLPPHLTLDPVVLMPSTVVVLLPALHKRIPWAVTMTQLHDTKLPHRPTMHIPDQALFLDTLIKADRTVVPAENPNSRKGVHTDLSSMSLSVLTKKLIADPDSLTPADIDDALTTILLDKDVHELQVAAFIVSARATKRDHRPDFIAATVTNLRKYALKVVPLSSAADEEYLDIVGTGGDGQNTFNVSTTAAIIAAGTGKVKVAKHGGPASTSTSGASDLLSHLSVDLAKVNDDSTPRLLAENDFVYMSGPIFHPILAKVKPIRKNLGIPTIFNLVGPLLNPVNIKARVLGVYTPSLGRVYAEASSVLFPGKPALVVCGYEGLDEISPEGKTHIWELQDSGEIKEYSVSPDDFGLPSHPLAEVGSGTPEENAAIVRNLVENKLPPGHPILDYVLINTAALLYISGAAKSFKDGVALARTSIEQGGAKKALNKFVETVGNLS